jgi:hypothetical protein
MMCASSSGRYALAVRRGFCERPNQKREEASRRTFRREEAQAPDLFPGQRAARQEPESVGESESAGREVHECDQEVRPGEHQQNRGGDPSPPDGLEAEPSRQRLLLRCRQESEQGLQHAKSIRCVAAAPLRGNVGARRRKPRLTSFSPGRVTDDDGEGSHRLFHRDRASEAQRRFAEEIERDEIRRRQPDREAEPRVRSAEHAEQTIQETEESDDGERQRRRDRHRDRGRAELALHLLLDVAGQESREGREENRGPAPADARREVVSRIRLAAFALGVVALEPPDGVAFVPRRDT